MKRTRDDLSARPKRTQSLFQCGFAARICPHHLDARPWNGSAQMRFALSKQALLSPLLTQAEFTSIMAAAGDQNTGGAVTQRILNE